MRPRSSEGGAFYQISATVNHQAQAWVLPFAGTTDFFYRMAMGSRRDDGCNGVSHGGGADRK